MKLRVAPEPEPTPQTPHPRGVSVAYFVTLHPQCTYPPSEPPIPCMFMNVPCAAGVPSIARDKQGPHTVPPYSGTVVGIFFSLSHLHLTNREATTRASAKTALVVNILLRGFLLERLDPARSALRQFSLFETRELLSRQPIPVLKRLLFFGSTLLRLGRSQRGDPTKTRATGAAPELLGPFAAESRIANDQQASRPFCPSAPTAAFPP